MAGRLKLGALSFLVCVVFFGGCDDSNKADKALKAPRQGGEVTRTDTEKEKARLLRKVDRKFENPEVHYELARMYQNDGLWPKAEYHYNNTLSFEPSHRRAQAGMVKILLASGDKARADILADIYAHQVSNSAEGSLRLALAYQEQHLDELAMACYQQALRLAPNSAKINRQIGYYYRTKGDSTQAKNYLVRSYQLDPMQPEVAGELGRLGVIVEIPRKTRKNAKKLDRIVNESDKQLTQ